MKDWLICSQEENLSYSDHKIFLRPEADFKEFEPRRWTTNNRFQLSADTNLETQLELEFLAELTMCKSRLMFERFKLFNFSFRFNK